MRKERDAKGTREYHQLDEITSKEYKPVADIDDLSQLLEIF